MKQTLDPEIDEAIGHALLERGGAPGLDPASPSFPPVDDQASRLRALVGLDGSAHVSAAEMWGRTDPAHAAAPIVPDSKRPAGPPLLTISSGKGGVGKTNLAVNLAIALAARGLRITLVDADLGTANADVLCGLMPAARLEHVLTPLAVHDGAARSIRDIAINAPGGFRLIPGCAGVAHIADLSPQQQRTLVESLAALESDTDLVIADTGAGVGQGVVSLAAAGDRLLIVTTPEPTSVADAYALIKCVAGYAADSLGAPPEVSVIVNQCVDEEEAARTHARLSAVCERFLGITPRSAGFVAQDVRVQEAVRARRPVLLNSPGCAAALNIRSVAAAIAQQMVLPERPHAVTGSRSGGLRGALARVLRLAGG